MDRDALAYHILNVSETDFDQVALDLFEYQCTKNPIYGQYCSLLGKSPENVHRVEEIPFLPVQVFKKYLVQTGEWTPETVFESSGTTGQEPSRHAVRSLQWYTSRCEQCFQYFYRNAAEYCWLALLPSYLERKNASLVAMAGSFINRSRYAESGFFLDQMYRLKELLQHNEKDHIPTILIGVSFALLDFVESGAPSLSSTIVMETGGMKGRRQEITREELHQHLQAGFQTGGIHSEYGMTEMFSQCYAMEGGIFHTPPTVRVLIADMTDPLAIVGPGKRGTIQVIDLANLDTCAFIGTQDVGIVDLDGSFRVVGRVDESEMRGCNLMVSDME